LIDKTQPTVTPNEAAAILGLTNKRVYQLVKEKRLQAWMYIPAPDVCKMQLKITRASVEAYLSWKLDHSQRKVTYN
jgi:hypothetical protein